MGYRSRRNGIALLVFLPLAAMVALRGDTRDTALYIDVFERTVEFPWDPLAFYAETGMEWGFGIASWFLNLLAQGPMTLFFLVSFGTFYFLGKASLNVALGPLEVAPYYLGSFFLLQQLMQIRQGLGAAFALWVVTLIAGSHRPVWKTAAAAPVAVMMHITAALPLLGAQLLRLLMPVPTRWHVALWSIGIVGIGVLLARAFMSLEVIASLGRLSVYAVDDEYSGERGLLAPANVRAALMLFLFLFASTPSLLRLRSFVLMTGLYAAHLGIRLGFFDFLILSGRLSTALGFVEVLLVPMLVRSRIRHSWLRWAIALSYFLLHFAATVTVQAPFLIDDYFTQLHAACSTA